MKKSIEEIIYEYLHEARQDIFNNISQEAVQEIYGSPDNQPDFVYHYTTLPALLNIANGDSEKETWNHIWATSAAYLNDPSELKTGLEILSKRYDKYMEITAFEEDDEEKDHIKSFIQNIVKNLNPETYMNLIDKDKEKVDHFRSLQEVIFVASFSGSRDDLTQWRMYADDGKGVCIGFDRRSIESIKDVSSVWVVYDVDKQNIIIDKLIEQVVEKGMLAYKKLKAESSDKKIVERFLRVFLYQIIAVTMPVFKRDDYKNENEFRLVIMNKKNEEDIRKYRISGSCIVSYIELKVESGQKLNINEIMLGPISNDMSVSTVYNMVKGGKLINKRIKIIEKSKKPYKKL